MREIQKLQVSLSSQKASMPEKYQKEVIKFDKKLCDTLMKIEELKSQIIQGTEASLIKDPGVYKLIEVKRLDKGNQYVFEGIDLKIGVYEILFPAIVHPFLGIQNTLYEPYERRWKILRQLGYEIDIENRTITFPDEALLNANCKLVQEKYPVLNGFEVVSSDNIASDVEFIDAFLEGKTILSNGIEFTHDHLVHIIPELLMRLGGDYSLIRETAALVLKPVRKTTKKIQESLKGDKDQAPIVVKQLLTMCSMWIDLYGADIFRPLKSFTNHNVLKFIRWVSLGSSILNDNYSLLKRNFDDRYPEAPLTKKRGELLSVLFSIIQYPNMVKFFREAPIENIRGALKGIQVTEIEDSCGLSFKTAAESEAPLEFNIEDSPLEVVEMILKSFGSDL